MANPLVSIRIPTYNSSKYVLETLESVKNQSYQEIELIITDDASRDNSVALCRDWLKENKSRFVNSQILTTDSNTGVSGNCNRMLAVANGEWLKGIAADDILHPDAITNYIEYVTSHPEVEAVFGRSIDFVGNISNCEYKLNPICLPNLCFGNSVTASDQYKLISKTYWGEGPTFFVKTELVKDLGGYDERFPLQEDFPLFIKLVKNGHKLYYMNKLTVLKRNRADSIIHEKRDKAICSRLVIRYVKEYKYQYQYECVNLFWKKLFDISLSMQSKIIDSGNDKTLFVCRFYYHLWKIFDPLIIYRRLLSIKENLIAKYSKNCVDTHISISKL